MDKKSPGVLSRLAKQASNMYGEASAMFNGSVLVQHFERSWVAHTQMKVCWVAKYLALSRIAPLLL